MIQKQYAKNIDIYYGYFTVTVSVSEIGILCSTRNISYNEWWSKVAAMACR